MTERIIAPYGEWESPIGAADVARVSGSVGEPAFVGDEVWWLELVPEEGGRASVRRRAPGGEPEDLLPAPWNARSRVHEYGGGAWAAADGDLVFVEFTDQRLYRLTPGGEPTPLTPADRGFRFGGISVHGDAVLAIRETHTGDGPSDLTRDVVLVPLDGSAATDASAITSVVAGSHFLAQPAYSPDGSKLAWIAWDHPNMPWDGTQLRVGDVGPDGRVAQWRTLLGGRDESVLQPEWRDDATLYALSDRTGWWNLYRLDAEDGAPFPVAPLEEDLGGALWRLDGRWYEVLPDGAIAATATRGVDRLVRIDPELGTATQIDTPFDQIRVRGEHDGTLLVVSGSAVAPSGIRLLHPDGRVNDVRLEGGELPDAAHLPDAEVITFHGPEREVHAVVYRPKNPRYLAPEGELPPFIALVHGGPTGHSYPELNLGTAYWTSRGIGVIDVNYGGSTGYGREYRDRLRGQWGVVDVEDTIAAVRGLAEAGIADGGRLLIKGGSAGGWTVLSALTQSDAFAAGASYFGVAELTEFAKETHDFESRYLDGLIGPLPEASDLYESRAPLTNVDRLATPVLLLQGLDDPIVPPAQAERFIAALETKGIPYAFRFYGGESHGFRKAETQIDARESELSFYGQVLGFAPPGVPVIELQRPEHR
ncbi:S9 family peptidase [Gryllotalpicola ginsengisoli]|uniref:S9 family peptidase n=1 Tax=Gryllotalpicola ginsengisoli TaxID=444608 RepID=UPI0003B77BF5|nr:prolyl oligopeptidase family serine peptidase [Gryllotalpicola ginsengisoli]